MLASILLKYCFKSTGVFAPENKVHFVKNIYSPEGFRGNHPILILQSELPLLQKEGSLIEIFAKTLIPTINVGTSKCSNFTTIERLTEVLKMNNPVKHRRQVVTCFNVATIN